MKPPTEPTSAKATVGKLLLGPGPSPVADRVMRAMPAPVLSHLDPEILAILDDMGRVRKRLLDEHGIEIGAGLGPLAETIWRVGLMGSGSTRANIAFLTGALKTLRA